MAPEALERLYDLGAQNDADIVIGKVTSDFRGVPHGVFRHTRNKVTIHNFPLIDSLTPHKMFRRDFLREHGIAFPEGKRRLEDQLYMVRAYFPAKTVSILGDYPCYFYRKRDDGKNAGTARIDPRGYYANLREVLDTVIANTEPGEFRDKLLRRFYRVEMLGRLSEPSFHQLPPAFRDGLFRAVRSIAMDLIDPSVDATLGPVPRLRSTLLRDDRPDALAELARRLAPTRATWSLDGLAWARGRLGITFQASIDTASGRDLVEPAGGDGLILDPALTADLLPAPFPVTEEEVAGLRANLLLRHHVSGAQLVHPLEDDPRGG